MLLIPSTRITPRETHFGEEKFRNAESESSGRELAWRLELTLGHGSVGQ